MIPESELALVGSTPKSQPSRSVVRGFFRFEGLQPNLADAFEVTDAISAEDEAKNLGDEVVELIALAQVRDLLTIRTGDVTVADCTRFHFAIAIHRFVAVTALASSLGVRATVAAR
jgi:hypothetical protein